MMFSKSITKFIFMVVIIACPFTSNGSQQRMSINIDEKDHIINQVTVNQVVTALNSTDNNERVIMDAYLQGLVDFAFEIGSVNSHLKSQPYCMLGEYMIGHDLLYMGKEQSIVLAKQLLSEVKNEQVVVAEAVYTGLVQKYPCNEKRQELVQEGRQSLRTSTSVSLLDTFTALTTGSEVEKKIMEAYISGLIDFASIYKKIGLINSGYKCLIGKNSFGEDLYYRNQLITLALAKQLLQQWINENQPINMNSSTSIIIIIVFGKKFTCDVPHTLRQYKMKKENKGNTY